MHTTAARADTVAFPEFRKDNGEAVNWLHLAVAIIVIAPIAASLSAFVQLIG